MNMKQMKKFSVIWGSFLVILILILTVFGFVYKSKASEYKKLEIQLIDATKKYVDAKFLYPEEKEQLKVTFGELKENQYIEELKKENDNCDGYVIVQHNGTVFEYHGYVKCPKYITKGYQE